MGKLIRVLGLMSGTSMDGIDVALLETDGEDRVERGPRATFAYPESFRALLRQAIADAKDVTSRTERPGCLAAVERELTERHAQAVAQFLADHGMTASDIDLLGFHGQTVLHRALPPGNSGQDEAKDAITVQIGDGALLAALTGIDVAYDLRAADVAAGGQGAPLAPAYHRALAARLPQRPLAFLNLGGIGNVTWIGEDGRLIAFDTGPANALLDDWVFRQTGQTYDADGALSRSGTTDQDVLRSYLLHPYFERPVPKSLDRGDFNLDPAGALSAANGAATLAELTATCVKCGLAWLPEPPALWLVGGGGRRNKHLMERLAWHLEAPVAPVEVIDLDGDSLEAEAWAYLAVRALNGLPISFPGTTGIQEALSGGVIARAPRA